MVRFPEEQGQYRFHNASLCVHTLIVSDDFNTSGPRGIAEDAGRSYDVTERPKVYRGEVGRVR